MNLGTLVLGLLNGLTIGLLAVGLVLIYKSNKFLNLAHAQLGALAALLLAKMVIDWGWNWWLAFGVAIVIGLGIGVVVERFVIAPLRRKVNSPIRLLLLSVGVSQLLLALTFLKQLRPDPDTFTFYPQPFTSHLRIGGVVLSGMYVLTMLVAPVLVVGLALFMRYSMLGKEIRAAANNPDAARLCGISVSRVSSVTWALAGTFSAMSAILQAPNLPTSAGAGGGPYLLMLTLGAAAFGAFVSLGGALVGGIILGLVSQIVSAETLKAQDAELAVFVVILAVVFVRGKAIARVFDLTGASVEELPVLRVPESLRRSALVRRQPQLLALAALGLGALLPQVPYFNTPSQTFLLTLVLIYALAGLGLTMLLGWAGQVSLGTFAIVGLGAFLTARWSEHHWSLVSILLVVGTIGAATMVVVGLPALRVRGLTLAVTTLGFGVISVDWLLHQPWAGSADAAGATVAPAWLGAGLGTITSQEGRYYLSLVMLVLGVAAAAALRRSIPGRLFVAVRDNERASAAFGINPAAVKLTILGVSGFFSAVAGVLWAFAYGTASTRDFTPDVSIALLAIPVIGGLGSVAGAVAASTLLYSLTFFVGPHLSALFGDFGHNIGFLLFLAGMGTVGTLLQFPTGIAGAAQRTWQTYLDRRGADVEAIAQTATTELPLRVQGVKVHFGGIVALDEPDITVRRGEIVGLIGTNGAGKTTLMNVISGVIRPDSGSVAVFGTEVADLAPDYRAAYHVARSFQDAKLFAGLTVLETIQVALSFQNKVGVVSALLRAPWAVSADRQTRRTAEDIVDRFGLRPWADARAADLSTGTRRICDIAAQVATSPKLILLDEPTAGVAQREAEAFGPLLRKIRDELDCSVLIVEHDMPLLMGLCDRIYALEAGRVIAEGSPEQIRNDPRVVASYLGDDSAAISRSGATDLEPAR